MPLEDSELFKSAMRRAVEEASILEDGSYLDCDDDSTAGVIGDIEDSGHSRKIKAKDTIYLKREEGITNDRLMDEMGELGPSGKRIKLEHGTYIKREEGVEEADTDHGYRRRRPRMKKTKLEEDPYVKREEGD